MPPLPIVTPSAPTLTTPSPTITVTHSFQATAIVAHWYEFRQWIDGEPGSGEPSGWKVWHSAHWRPQRAATRGRKLLLFFGQKFAPKLVMFTCLTAALRIDPIGDGVRLNFAMFRSFITISACVIYWVIATDRPQPCPSLSHPQPWP